MRITTVTLSGLILLMIVAMVLFLPTLHTINTRFALATNDIRILEQSGEVVKKINVIELKRRTKNIVDKLAAPLPPTPLKYIDVIRKYEKDGIKINGFLVNDASNRTIEIKGVATTRQNIQNLVNNLQSESGILSVNSPVANFIKNNQGDFTITVVFKEL